MPEPGKEGSEQEQPRGGAAETGRAYPRVEISRVERSPEELAAFESPSASPSPLAPHEAFPPHLFRPRGSVGDPAVQVEPIEGGARAPLGSSPIESEAGPPDGAAQNESAQNESAQNESAQNESAQNQSAQGDEAQGAGGLRGSPQGPWPPEPPGQPAAWPREEPPAGETRASDPAPGAAAAAPVSSAGQGHAGGTSVPSAFPALPDLAALPDLWAEEAAAARAPGAHEIPGAAQPGPGEDGRVAGAPSPSEAINASWLAWEEERSEAAHPGPGGMTAPEPPAGSEPGSRLDRDSQLDSRSDPGFQFGVGPRAGSGPEADPLAGRDLEARPGLAPDPVPAAKGTGADLPATGGSDPGPVSARGHGPENAPGREEARPPDPEGPASHPPPSSVPQPPAAPSLGPGQPVPAPGLEPPPPAAPAARWQELGEEPRSRQLPPMAFPPLTRGSTQGSAREPEEEQGRPLLRATAIMLFLLAALGGLGWGGWWLWDHRSELGLHSEPSHGPGGASRPGQDAGLNPAAPSPQPSSAAPARPTNAPSSSGPFPSGPSSSGPSSSGPSSSAAASSAGPPSPARSGQATPPPKRADWPSAAAPRRARDPGYHPEIVPPYPTLPQHPAAAPEMAAASTAAASTSTAQPASASASRGAAEARPQVSAAATQPAAPPPLGIRRPTAPVVNQQRAGRDEPGMGPSAPPPAYANSPDGTYMSPLAQNIVAVQQLQRQSVVPLREFHGRLGAPAPALRTVTLTLQSADASSGSYSLLVTSGGASYPLRGRVNVPLYFTDATTRQAWALVVLRLAGGTAYGYVRPPE